MAKRKNKKGPPRKTSGKQPASESARELLDETGGATPSGRDAAGPQEAQAANDVREVPRWVADERKLYWRGRELFQLAVQASTEAQVLKAFEHWKWASVIRDPMPRDTIGDATHARRSAIYNLNQHLGKRAPIVFFSTHNGHVGWRANDIRTDDV